MVSPIPVISFERFSITSMTFLFHSSLVNIMPPLNRFRFDIRFLPCYGFHPPTIYFPLVVHGALMIEPTESEAKETLDQFIESMVQIAKEAETDPEAVRSAPHRTKVSRLDEVLANRKPRLRWKPE